jgi:hypothetical protein
MSDKDRQNIIASVHARDVKTRASIGGLLLPKPEAAALLFDFDPIVRQAASEFILSRNDWHEVVRLATPKSHPADPTIYNVEDEGQQLDAWITQIRNTPTWARVWRSYWIDSLEIKNTGQSLGFDQALDTIGYAH